MYTAAPRKHQTAHKHKRWRDEKTATLVVLVCNFGLMCAPLSSVELWQWLHNSFTVGSMDTLTHKTVLALKMIKMKTILTMTII